MFWGIPSEQTRFPTIQLWHCLPTSSGSSSNHALQDLNWTTLYLLFAQSGRCNAASQFGLYSTERTSKTLLKLGKAKTGSATVHLAHQGSVLGKADIRQEQQAQQLHICWKLKEPRERRLWKTLAKPCQLDQSTENNSLKVCRGECQVSVLEQQLASGSSAKTRNTTFTIPLSPGQ